MKKRRYSLNLDVATITAIDAAAIKNRVSRSAIARMFLDMVNHVPVDMLKETSPIPAFFGFRTGGHNGNHQ